MKKKHTNELFRNLNKQYFKYRDSSSLTFLCAACTSSICFNLSERASAMSFSLSWPVFSNAAILASLK